MAFPHRDSVQRAVDLLNVLLPEPDPAAVARVLREHGETDISDVNVADLHAAALELRAVFAAPDVATAASVLNALFAAYARPPRLTDHEDGYGWHLHVDTSDDGPWGAWLVTSSALGLASLLAERQDVPGGLCASPPCGKPFAHTGGGSPRKYCSPRCATRERVAAHRGRNS
ncbi:CGNR zinc finger domain-containing protein [Amycolatopsis sp. SID8362]|uniref:CGNR zinc finger domain-containing protein n=1 Tax=Amycolatopsis sp. SID8362 TaxID=2690346 RepID=UPI00136D37A2|nr:CGNR zinc finger domain-containing protein [Amycolatopsis sp. SID8362]NBH01787.1 CGNR zinc finger domain-containing protein [Amycolatopsis sp. SID8362]NED38488.1 CGNR zinc finger domain-containing protein [Amycolatopsis sp. SID8362]